MQVDPQAPELVTEDFVAMMNATGMCVLIHDAETKRILWANPAACDVLGWSVTELRPLTATDMSSSASQYDRVLGRAWLHEAVVRGRNRIEWHYRTKTGRIVPTDAVAVRVELAQGPALMVQFRDIEREQEVAQQLRLTTSYVDALSRHTSTIALMLDRSGTVRFATDRARDLLGGAPMEPLTTYGRLRSDGRVCGWEDLVARADPVASLQLEVPVAGVWLEGSLERLRENDGLLLLLHDVSGRVAEESRRERRLQQENHHARYTAMGDMAMAIAHELGQPLAAAGNFLDGARRHASALPAADGVRVGLDSAVVQIQRAREIVNATRVFVGHLEHVDQVVDLDEVLDECLHFVRLRAAPPGVEVVVHRPGVPLLAWCERVLTGQVLLNLAFNAIDEAAACPPERRRVTITSGWSDGEGVITVDDDGRGLSRDPFEESFTSKEQGSGIGLALSHRIITRQHGRIWAEQRPGGGTRFGFALPLAADVASGKPSAPRGEV
jgi:two-component system, LuxR family, sensor kinase FixL